MTLIILVNLFLIDYLIFKFLRFIKKYQKAISVMKATFEVQEKEERS